MVGTWLSIRTQFVIIMCIRYTRIYLILMAVSMVMRPTGGVMWVPLVIVHLMRGGHHLWIVLREGFVVG